MPPASDALRRARLFQVGRFTTAENQPAGGGCSRNLRGSVAGFGACGNLEAGDRRQAEPSASRPKVFVHLDIVAVGIPGSRERAFEVVRLLRIAAHGFGKRNHLGA